MESISAGFMKSQNLDLFMS